MKRIDKNGKIQPWLLWRNRRFTSLLLGNFLTITAVFSLLLLLVILLAYQFSARSVYDQLSENNQISLQESVTQMEQNIRRGRGTLLVIAQNRDVEYFLRQDKSLFSEYEQVAQVSRIQQMINSYIAGDGFLDSIVLYDRQRQQIISDNGLLPMNEGSPVDVHDNADTGWLPLIEPLLVQGYLAPIPRRNQRNMPVLTILQSAPLLLREWKGMVAANLNTNRLFDAVGGNFPYLVTDEDGTIIGASDRSLITRSLEEEILPSEVWKTKGTHIISSSRQKNMVSVVSSVYGWWFYVTDTMEAYNARMTTFNRVMILLGAAGILLCALFAYVISLRIFLPIRGLMRTLKERSDELSMPLEDREETGNEIAFLSNTILHSMDRNRELSDSLSERLRRITAVRLQMLRSQINPHFLYNTLASINWMVLEKLPEGNEVSEAICLLSDLLRTALKSPTLVPLAQELEQTERYLALQKLCLTGNMEWETEIDPAAWNAMTPSMLLQPLAENAVKHGLDPRDSEQVLHILISIRREDDQLHLVVRDNGQSVSPEKMQELKDQLSHGTENSIGLNNVEQKLQLIFEDKARLTLRSVYPHGFEVEIVHPYLEISDQLSETEHPLDEKRA